MEAYLAQSSSNQLWRQKKAPAHGEDAAPTLPQTYGVFTIPVETWGSAGRALVFLPGLGVHPSYYEPSMAVLAEDLMVVLPDLSFRSHSRLHWGVDAYAECVEELCAERAPNAVRAGHSFGGMLAMLGRAPSIACSPSVPVELRWPAAVYRAVLLQLEEYGGREGWDGVRFAGQIMWDYVRTAARHPRMLFPVVNQFHRGITGQLEPVTQRAHVILSRADRLYRDAEYARYLALLPGGYTLTTVDASHDWPVTRPRLFARLIVDALATVEVRERQRDRPQPTA